MISKTMYKLLRKIPHSPSGTTFADLANKNIMDINLLNDLLKDANNNNYIAFSAHMPYNDLKRSKFCLTETGQVAIEEYEGTTYNTKLSTWAIVISALSFVASVVAIVVSCVPQQNHM